MIEEIGGGIVGAVLGGVFRLAPEVIKFFDRKNERVHEAKMFEMQCALEAQRGAQKLQEIGAQHAMAVDQGVLAGLKGVIDQQTEMVKAAGGWVASLSASVRPVVTYWILGVWTFVHMWFAYMSYRTGMEPTEVFKMAMNADFTALVAGILNYYFLNRTLEKRGL